MLCTIKASRRDVAIPFNYLAKGIESTESPNEGPRNTELGYDLVEFFEIRLNDLSNKNFTLSKWSSSEIIYIQSIIKFFKSVLHSSVHSAVR